MDEKDLLKGIVYEFGKIIDDTLLPETTISSFGLKMAARLHWRIKQALPSKDGELKHAAFINAISKALRSEFNYEMVPEVIEKERIRFKIKDCPFKEAQSNSLCSIMTGIVGGISFSAFGYCKIVRLSGPEQAPSPCSFDMFITPSAKADRKVGIEFSKNTISLLKGESEKYIDSQRQARRKLILGLFSNMAVSLRENPSVKRLVHKYIESLSCIPEIRIAAIYLRDEERNKFTLEDQYGIPGKFISKIAAVSIDEETGSRDNGLFAAIEGFNDYRLEIAKATSTRAFATFQIKTKNDVVGILNIGWKATFPVSTETIEAIKASCTLLGTAIDNSRLYFELEKTYISNCTILNNLVDTVDHFSNDHSRRVAELAKAMAEEMGLQQDEVIQIYDAGSIHDIGKINVPAEILNKPGKLTDKEFELIKEHPVTGAKLLSPIAGLKSLIPAVKYHHERMDGSGYPEGLSGEDIPLHARVIAVADVYDAMINDRSYRHARDQIDIIQEIVDSSGTKYDPKVVAALIAVLGDNSTTNSEDEEAIENFALDL